MKMAGIEKFFIRSPFRVFLQRKFEAPRVLDGLYLPDNSVCLEIGSGLGAGALLINQYFNCLKIIGIDIDPDMVESAKNYIYHSPGWAAGIKNFNIDFQCQDAAHTSFPDDTFDGCFLFGVLDHIPDWQAVIAEVARVLKPGGKFSFEEFLLGKSAENWLGHVSIGEEELLETLTNAGFELKDIQRGKFVPNCYIRVVKL